MWGSPRIVPRVRRDEREDGRREGVPLEAQGAQRVHCAERRGEGGERVGGEEERGEGEEGYPIRGGIQMRQLLNLCGGTGFESSYSKVYSVIHDSG